MHRSEGIALLIRCCIGEGEKKYRNEFTPSREAERVRFHVEIGKFTPRGKNSGGFSQRILLECVRQLGKEKNHHVHNRKNTIQLATVLSGLAT